MTDFERWRAVDEYICGLFVGADPALDGALEASDAAGLPAVQVTANQGKLLQLLARMIGARRILEVGTLGAYSTIWLARALPPGGQVITMEIDGRHAEVARANLERAGVSDRVTLLEGAAADSLSRLDGEDIEPFDMVFIDADKQNNPVYFDFALRLTRPGSVIVVDNVVRQGNVADASSADPGVVGTRRLNEVMAAEPRVSVTEIQTVGAKGYDGFAVALVLGR
ncbi:MAG TPA: O-methyltransferase [Acidimicrobiales bacterium]|nr:O-methyltransferase [Acidimicrobiales bacterium]